MRHSCRYALFVLSGLGRVFGCGVPHTNHQGFIIVVRYVEDVTFTSTRSLPMALLVVSLISCAQIGSSPDANNSVGCGRSSISIRGPAMSFVLDDGDKRDASLFLPLFKRLGVPVATALVTQVIGDRTHVSADDVRRFVAAGWEIESHSVSHPDLTTTKDLVNEIEQSKRDLLKLQVPVSDVFTYPYGKWNPTVVAAMCTSYRYGMAVNGNINSGRVNPWNLSRYGLDPGNEASLTDRRVQESVNTKGWLIWVIHSYVWDAASTLSEVEYAVKAAQTKGVKIVLPSNFLQAQASMP
jgi:peptidoglycan/xylan/chitin deacetylase (PgdA/CDA1 family)